MLVFLIAVSRFFSLVLLHNSWWGAVLCTHDVKVVWMNLSVHSQFSPHAVREDFGLNGRWSSLDNHSYSAQVAQTESSGYTKLRGGIIAIWRRE